MVISTDSPRTRTVTWEPSHPKSREAMNEAALSYYRGIRDGLYPRPPFGEMLDLDLDEVEPGFVVFTMVPAEYHYNPLGTVHGGMIATLLDSAMGCAVHTTLPPGVGFTTLEIKVNYVKAVTEATGKVFAEGRVVHSGRSSAVAEGKLLDERGALLALASTTCAVLRPLGSAQA